MLPVLAMAMQHPRRDVDLGAAPDRLPRRRRPRSARAREAAPAGRAAAPPEAPAASAASGRDRRASRPARAETRRPRHASAPARPDRASADRWPRTTGAPWFRSRRRSSSRTDRALRRRPSGSPVSGSRAASKRSSRSRWPARGARCLRASTTASTAANQRFWNARRLPSVKANDVSDPGEAIEDLRASGTGDILADQVTEPVALRLVRHREQGPQHGVQCCDLVGVGEIGAWPPSSSRTRSLAAAMKCGSRMFTLCGVNDGASRRRCRRHSPPSARNNPRPTNGRMMRAIIAGRT